MGMEQLFRLARTTTVAQLLERDDFARRMAASQPVSVLELLYPLMQAYDSVAVRADVELGGTDQTFNLLLGRDVQRAFGQPEQAVLTVPILPGLQGDEKMSKSLHNHVGVTEPPEEMFGKTMSLPDEAMGTWFELLGIEPPAAQTAAMDAKRALARAIVERFWGAEAARRAEEHFDRTVVRHEAPEQIDDLLVARDGDRVHLPAIIASGFGHSRSEARRLLAQGAVRLDGEELSEDDLDLPAERLDGAVLQVGRRRFRRLRVG
jgi:tyrosyl-tRNA synthetase